MVSRQVLDKFFKVQDQKSPAITCEAYSLWCQTRNRIINI